MFKKTVKWSVGEGRRHPVNTPKASFKTLNINQILQEQQDSNIRLLNRLKNKRAVFDVLVSAPDLRPHVTSAMGQAKFFAQCQTVVTNLNDLSSFTSR